MDCNEDIALATIQRWINSLQLQEAISMLHGPAPATYNRGTK